MELSNTILNIFHKFSGVMYFQNRSLGIRLLRKLYLVNGLLLNADTGLPAPLEGGLYMGELKEERFGEGVE